MSDEEPIGLRQNFDVNLPTFGSNSEDMLTHTEYMINACAKRIGAPPLPHFACRKKVRGVCILICGKQNGGEGTDIANPSL